MDDCISRQATLKEICDMYHAAEMSLLRLPSVQPERKCGKWVMDENPHDGDCRCSVCRIAIDAMHERNHEILNALTNNKWWTFYNYCPNCGADMRGEKND